MLSLLKYKISYYVMCVRYFQQIVYTGNSCTVCILYLCGQPISNVLLELLSDMLDEVRIIIWHRFQIMQISTYLN
jgi:hypothetical protein